jgi:hypothetical protein
VLQASAHSRKTLTRACALHLSKIQSCLSQDKYQPGSLAYTCTDGLEGGSAVGFFYSLLRFVKLLLALAIFLLFLRAILWPSALDLLILMLLFIVFVAMFIGGP